MFKFLRKKKAQSTVEYAILIIIIIGALLSIQIYIKRGVQGRLRSAADDIGDQYDPGNTNVTTIISSNSQSRDTFSAGVTTSNITLDNTTVTSSTNIINTQQTFWGQTE